MKALSAAPALARTKMLVIDDSAAMREIMKTILRGLGVGEVLLARGAEDATSILGEQVPDLIFVDWRMPSVDGLALVRRLRTAPDSPCPFVPIIMCTGYTDALHVKTARDAGVTEFLAKPVSAETVARRIEEVIRRPRDFVRAQRFFGPDRRRIAKDYVGPGRRLIDTLEPSSELGLRDE